MALLAELAGENPFKVRAYANAARAIARGSGDIEALAARGDLTSLPGIGKGIAAIVAEVIGHGEPAQLAVLRAGLPAGLPELVALPGLGPKRARALWHELGIASLGELEYACRENRLVAMAGFGPATQKRILDAIEFRRRAGGSHHISDGWRAAEETAAAIMKAAPGAPAVVAGEVRRSCEIVAEALVVCAAPSCAALLSALAALLQDAAADAAGGAAGRHPSGVPVRVVTAPRASFGAALVWHTGNARHLEQLAARAATGGLSFAAGNLTDASGRAVDCGEETNLYEKLGLPWIPPELREGDGEIEAAAAGALPELVRETDILGALHVHTTDSDGTAPLDAMADAAAALGWSLLGIADHSQAAAYAHGLDAARLRAQGDAVAARNARGGAPLVLRGTEADILADGALDLPEGVPLDFVVASVHSSFRQSREAQTARLVRAVSRGPGTILGHPTGRLLLAREGYQVDLEAVLQAAAASGAAVEINAHPFRLDLDWRWVRRAVALGVPISIGPDAHDPSGLADVRWGVGIARKGWATAGHVLNTGPWPWWR
ncbi:MAG TPA: helix-hairpin-helix domain-containing protein, partial [Thermoanaerobaculaceae bacterium]|nr:helix-hairpin-helix domain-containing protein [Thermoanaerobaculaceae bacterium]